LFIFFFLNKSTIVLICVCYSCLKEEFKTKVILVLSPNMNQDQRSDCYLSPITLVDICLALLVKGLLYNYIYKFPLMESTPLAVNFCLIRACLDLLLTLTLLYFFFS